MSTLVAANAVTLTEAEMYHGKWVAETRQRLAERDGRRDTYGLTGTREEKLQKHIDGVYGEIAVARTTGLYWHALLNHEDRQRLPDVGKDIQVRACADQHRLGRKGSLLMHREDKDFHRYALVDGVAPHLEIVGWVWGCDGKDEDYWRPDWERPCFQVPRGVLCQRPL